MKRYALLFAMCTLISGMAYADVTVNFPGDNTFYSTAANGSGLMGANGGVSQPLSTQGDFISQTFASSQPYFTGMTVDWSLVDYFGGNPGASYENDIYLNGAFVGYFTVDDCGYCNSIESITGSITFNQIPGFGSYTLSIVLGQNVPNGGGSEWFTEFNGSGDPATTTFSPTPEPGSIALFGSGVLGLAGVLRRKISR